MRAGRGKKPTREEQVEMRQGNNAGGVRSEKGSTEGLGRDQQEVGGGMRRARGKSSGEGKTEQITWGWR